MYMKLNTAAFIKTILVFSFLATSVHAANTSNDKTIAVVNGHNISQWTLDRYAQQRNLSSGNISPQQKKALIEELINRELIFQDAVSLGVDKTPAIKSEIDFQRVNIIASTMVSRSSDRLAVSEADMKKEYEARKSELGGKELKARHILLETEQSAKNIISKLNKGADFAELASSHSTGPSAENGGDLGWFRVDQMVKPFSEAASKLAKGSYTKKPVKTEFGWHVILLEDSRTVEAPSYDTIKEQIRVGLQNNLIEQYISGLRKKAKIERQ